MVHCVVDYTKEYHGYIVPWTGICLDAKMNFFTWSKEENGCTFLGNQYNEEFNNWQGPNNNGQFRPQNFKEKRKTEYTCSKYAGSAKFNCNPREGKMIRNEMWGVFSLLDPQNI